MDIKKALGALPATSGVYLMKDKKGKVLYVGKAVCLQKRVQSYFRKRTGPSSKIDALVLEIQNIDYIQTASEAEALILEASLIKKFHPKYNVDLRDDKSYPFILVTKEAFPRIDVVRPHKEKISVKEGKLFGPYVNAGLIREALKIIRRIFHFRTCQPLPKKACLDFHIGLCDAPCIGNISKKEYKQIIRNVCLILEGRKDDLYKTLLRQMETSVKSQEFEKAAKVRDQIRAIGSLYSGSVDVNYFKEAEQLQRALNLPRRPERIEAFDISNIMGNQAVGAMVSFLNGKPDKAHYRKFRIREVVGIDDFKMIAEVVRRRYRRLKSEGALFPDLILIDGGKGQLSAAKYELEKLEVQIPLASLAKRNEEIYLPGKRNPIVLDKDSLGLRLVQRIRDEAHRFAVSYHRKLRSQHAFEKEA